MTGGLRTITNLRLGSKFDAEGNIYIALGTLEVLSLLGSLSGMGLEDHSIGGSHSGRQWFA